mmetsp:Transcript_16047/g.23611  ORF Transcript_16047/g.23611 Transcript_16047/m.23611 type:complete len:103 (+) Transcript_16047:112-420(+)
MAYKLQIQQQNAVNQKQFIDKKADHTLLACQEFEHFVNAVFVLLKKQRSPPNGSFPKKFPLEVAVSFFDAYSVLFIETRSVSNIKTNVKIHTGAKSVQCIIP